MSDSDSSKKQKRILFSVWAIAIVIVLVREPLLHVLQQLIAQ